jgi:Flp pilus assembly pilin Flp
MLFRQRLNRLNKKTGFSILEYALLITAIVIGLVAAQTYLTRAVSSKWRESADSFGNGRQLKFDGPSKTVIIHHEN